MTHVIFLIENSEAIKPVVQDYLDQINNHIKPDCRYTIVLYNDHINYVCINKTNVTELKESDLELKGKCAFYDNVSTIVHKLLSFRQGRPAKCYIFGRYEDTASHLLTERQMYLQLGIANAKKFEIFLRPLDPIFIY